MSPALPARPSLEHLKKQAKELLHSAEVLDPAAVERFRSLGISSSGAKLADAQLVLARSYGASSWTRAGPSRPSLSTTSRASTSGS